MRTNIVIVHLRSTAVPLGVTLTNQSTSPADHLEQDRKRVVCTNVREKQKDQRARLGILTQLNMLVFSC